MPPWHVQGQYDLVHPAGVSPTDGGGGGGGKNLRWRALKAFVSFSGSYHQRALESPG